jgi:hypothetical protein
MILTALRKFGRLGAADRRAFVRAGFAILGVRIALAIVPFRIVSRAPQIVSGRNAGQGEIERTRWAVSAAGQKLGVTCLCQALAAQRLFARQGLHTELRFGAAKSGGAVIAHAWLESSSVVVFGDPKPAAYTSMQKFALEA